MDMQSHGHCYDEDHDREFTAHGPASPRRSAASAAPRPVAAPIGSGWYHDAAIDQARAAAIEARCNPYG